MKPAILEGRKNLSKTLEEEGEGEGEREKETKREQEPMQEKV